MITELHSLIVKALRDGVDVDNLLALAREQLELDRRVEALTEDKESSISSKPGTSSKAGPSVDWDALLNAAPKWEGGKNSIDVASVLTGEQFPPGTLGTKFVQLSRKLGKREGYRKDGKLWYSE